MEAKGTKTRSGLRRSLMALAILSAPVVSIAGFSGTASADLSGVSVTEKCDVAPIGISVTAAASNNGHKYEVDYQLLPSGTVIQATDDFKPGTGGSTYSFAVTDGTYKVTLTRDDDIVIREVTVDCDRAGTDTFTVDPICTGTKGILVTLTSKYNVKSPYDLSVSYPDGLTTDFRDFADTDFVEVVPNTTPKTYTATLTFLYGEGDYEVTIVHRVTGKTVKYQNTPQTAEYELTCESSPPTSRPGGGYNFTFNLPKLTTTPDLPSTGSDSSTSLLVIAPMMVLLGAGLILARRRLANA